MSVDNGGELEDVVLEIESVADTGNCYAQSLLGFVYGVGMGRARSEAKAVLYHYFAAEGGDLQSKLARAYMYARQEVATVKTVKLVTMSHSLCIIVCRINELLIGL